MKKKFLILGSAPSITQWCQKYLEQELNAGYFLCAINNAWNAFPDIKDKLKIWFRSADFFYFQYTIKPDEELRNKWYEVVRFLSEPCWYERKDNGTMILNAICHIINLGENNNRKIILHIAGSNLIYENGQSHFYGKGTPDPLRLGEEYLKKQLCSINGFAEEHGHKIYNVDYQENTLLPFERLDL